MTCEDNTIRHGAPWNPYIPLEPTCCQTMLCTTKCNLSLMATLGRDRTIHLVRKVDLNNHSNRPVEQIDCMVQTLPAHTLYSPQCSSHTGVISLLFVWSYPLSWLEKVKIYKWYTSTVNITITCTSWVAPCQLTSTAH